MLYIIFKAIKLHDQIIHLLSIIKHLQIHQHIHSQKSLMSFRKWILIEIAYVLKGLVGTTWGE